MWSQTWPPPPLPAALPVETAPAEPAPLPPDMPPAPPAVDISTELLRVLEAVTTMCDRVIEFVEADRAERHLMIEVLTKLSRSVTTTETVTTADVAPAPNGNGNGERVVGGSMVPGPEPAIDLRERETAVEVRCRFGDRWVDGFEIFEVLHNDLGVHYRLRRRVDGVVLPELFGAAAIRHVETFEELMPASAHDRHWSPL
jgi:hypothetical protein